MYYTRRRTIKNMLNAKPFVSLKELEEVFPQVSSMTLRRDIEYLERAGEAIKVRGGARSMKFITTSMEEKFNLRLNENIDAKTQIAKIACREIETGRSIFLDSGTTMLKLAELMADQRVTVTTTGPNVALELIKKHFPIVNMVGGMLNRDNVSIAGSQAIRYLCDVNIDVAFIVPSGFSLQSGLTSGNFSECELKKFIVEKARKIVVLMDASKLDKNLPYTFCDFEKIDMIITDKPLPSSVEDAAKLNDIKIVVATNH